MRYNQILPLISFHKPKTIVEVGTWNGLRAIMMATEALKHQDKVHYIGFDLFEDATKETDKRELNVKPHCALADVANRLEQFQNQNPGFQFTLVKGDTRQTLKQTITRNAYLRKPRRHVDLAFIDGGHSVETIANDFKCLEKSKIVVLDDFYTDRDTDEHGCNFLLKGRNHLVLPHADPVKGGGKVQMAILPSEAWPGPKNLVVMTKNCVPDAEIRSNIKYAMGRFERWVRECRAHGETAIMVSGGPSLKDHLDDIAAEQGFVVCVKHAHDMLIEKGIVPWACMLLDPRDHVRDFIENPHPEVIYFTASMCHPTTVDRLMEKNAKIWGYNAHVGAGEENVLTKGHIMIGGGSTSAIRGISVLHALGFRRFKLYGYDSCYDEPQDKTATDKMGRQKYFKVKVNDVKYWTDSELLAQAQDFDKLMMQGMDMEIDVVGDGMIAEIWRGRHAPRPEFTELLYG